MPCDIEDLVLTSIPAKRQKSYKLENGHFVEEAETNATRSISLAGTDSSAPRQNKLEVVGERPGTAAVTRIRADVHLLASHGGDHIKVTVSQPSQSDLVQRFPGAGTFDFPVYRTHADSMFGEIFERYFTLHLDPADYTIVVESCGVRNTGVPIGDGQLDVLVYPHDQYTLSLSVPPFAKRSYAISKITTDDGTTTTVKGERAGDVSTSETTDPDGWTTQSTTAEGYTISRGTKTIDLGDGTTAKLSVSDVKEAKADRASLTLKKNGETEDVSVNLKNLLEVMTSVETAVQEIRNLVKSWVPQVGFKFDVGVSFLSGTLAMSWGWKEYSDYQVYFGWTASVSLWLFKVGLEISFGLSVGFATVRVKGVIADAGVNVRSSWEFNRPGHAVLPSTARAVGVVPIELIGEGEINLYFVSAKAAAGVKSGFTVEGGTRLTSISSLEAYAEIEWVGMDAFTLTQDFGEAPEEHDYHLIDKKDIWKGKIPI